MSEGEVAEGIVLRLSAYGEADRMASLLMSDGARRELRIAQARRSRKRFGGLDAYVRMECRFTPDRKGRPRLDSVQIQDGHDGLRGDVVRAALAAHVSELAQQASQEGHPLPDLYRLVHAALLSVAQGAGDERPLGWARGFELKLLHVLGVRPSITRDASSGGALQGTVRWSTTHGGAIGQPGPVDARSLPITMETLNLMNQALRTPLADQAEVPWTPTAGNEAEAALRDFLAVHVGRRSRARAFLSQLVSGLPAVALLAFSLLGVGCPGYEPPETVRVQGYLFETTAPVEGATVVTGSVSFALSSDGELLSEGVEPFSDSPGWVRFSGLAPLTQHHHVFAPPPGEAAEAGHVTTVISGASASDDLFVDAGTFHLFPRATVEGWLAGWELADPELPLPSLDPATDDGGFVRAQVLDPGASLGVRLALVDAEAAQHPAVYLDADGSPSSSQEGLSESGGFYVFGAAPGAAILRVQQDDGSLSGDGLPLWIEEDGVTSLPRVALDL